MALQTVTPIYTGGVAGVEQHDDALGGKGEDDGRRRSQKKLKKMKKSRSKSKKKGAEVRRSKAKDKLSDWYDPNSDVEAE